MYSSNSKDIYAVPDRVDSPYLGNELLAVGAYMAIDAAKMIEDHESI